MTESELNFNEFQAVTKNDWLDGANSQLKVEDAQEKLSWEFIQGHELSPYYDKSDTTELGYLHDFFKNCSFEWELFKTIEVSDSKEANERALKALNEGCTGVVFRMAANTDLSELTKRIQFEHCFVSFVASSDQLDVVSQFVSDHSIKGFVASSDQGLYLSLEEKISPITDVLIRYATGSEDTAALTIRVGSNFFFEIARIRTFRYLANRIDEVLGRAQKSLWIHADIVSISDEDKNLLQQTSAGLSAIIGGTNSVSFHSQSDHDRMTTNIGNLIREEAKITTYRDASSGSYFIDSITDQMIRDVWSDFQTKMP